MGRYLTRTGVVVNVSDEKAEALGSQLSPLPVEKDDKPARKPRASSKSSNS